MSECDEAMPRFEIDPEPTAAELVAILASLQSAKESEPAVEAPSRWEEIGRREQLHKPLDDRRTGWTR